MILFNKVRKRDINIEVAISDEEKNLIYYMFRSSFYNTVDKKQAERISKNVELVGEKKIKAIRLEQLFESLHLHDIDFLNVDVEGHDINVLKSNNWSKFRPKVIIVEISARKPGQIENNDILTYLQLQGYIYYCNSPTNGFFIEEEYYSKRFPNK